MINYILSALLAGAIILIYLFFIVLIICWTLDPIIESYNQKRKNKEEKVDEEDRKLLAEISECEFKKENYFDWE